MQKRGKNLAGIGLYTVPEAGRLLDIAPSEIKRWLRGHEVDGWFYDPLWSAQADLGDGGLFLGFRDLKEVRVATAFIDYGLSPQRLREAIKLARDLLREDRPLSTTRFRTDGRTVFLQIVQQDGETQLIDLFKKQFAFKEIIERGLINVDYDNAGHPAMWWPLGKAKSVVLDPKRSFGQPIEAETSVPVANLAAAAFAEGSAKAAAKAWDVPLRAVQRALAFEREMDLRLAA